MKLIIKEINKREEWKSFFNKYSPQSFFQSWEWGEVEKKHGKKVWRLGCFDDKKILGITQVIKVAAKRGNFLHVRHGPIFIDNSSYAVAIFCLNWLKKLAKDENCSFIRISPLISPTESHLWKGIGFRPAPIHNMDAEVTSVIDLSLSEEELLKNMRKTTRNLVRKAEKIGVNIISGIDKERLNQFLKLFKEAAEHEHFISNRGVEKELEIFLKENKAKIYLATFQEQILAGAIVIYNGHQAIYRYGATNYIVRHIPGSYLLQWQIVRDAKRRGLKFYNLWGITESQDLRHPWYGFSHFKMGFGGSTYRYMHASDYPLKKSYYFTYLFELAVKYIRGYDKIFFFRLPTYFRTLAGV